MHSRLFFQIFDPIQSLFNMTTITNLAFKGGGVLGIAYAGAIKVLEERNMLPAVQRVAGTSAGALTALILALRYNAQETYDIVSGTNFKDFEDHKNFARILTTYGVYQGETLLEWVVDKITRKGLPANATFLDLRKAGYRDLHVFSTNLNRQNITAFSVDTTPNVVVAEAVRASMSIPLFFKAWKFTGNNPDSSIYVDGGVLYNYPLSAFDSGGSPNALTLGFYLTDLQDLAPPNDLGYDDIPHYVKYLFETLMNSQDVDFKNDPEQESRTVLVDDFGISATNFDITPAQITQLYQSGIDCTNKYLDGKQKAINPLRTGE